MSTNGFYRRHGPLTVWLIGLAAFSLFVSIVAALSPVGERVGGDPERTACGLTVGIVLKVQEPAMPAMPADQLAAREACFAAAGPRMVVAWLAALAAGVFAVGAMQRILTAPRRPPFRGGP